MIEFLAGKNLFHKHMAGQNSSNASLIFSLFFSFQIYSLSHSSLSCVSFFYRLREKNRQAVRLSAPAILSWGSWTLTIAVGTKKGLMLE